jgi:hypothetical protein
MTIWFRKYVQKVTVANACVPPTVPRNAIENENDDTPPRWLPDFLSAWGRRIL